MNIAARTLLREVKTQFYRSFYSKNCRLELDRGIVSLTFDDVPHSTFENAVPMLHRAGYRATFYIAGQMAEQSLLPGSSRNFVSFQEACWLHEQGHEIGCHTFSHRRPVRGAEDAYVRDALKNRDLLQEKLGGVAVEHFAYPFGALTLGVKGQLKYQYRSLRSTRPGVNVGTADMALLLAVSIYSATLDQNYILSMLAAAREKRGWLIFYTHDVENPARQCGVSIQNLEWVLTQIDRSGCELLTIGDACRKISASFHRSHREGEDYN